MTEPTFTDADLYRLLYESETAHLEYDLDVSLNRPGECKCCRDDVTSCRNPEKWAGGLIVLDCSNTERVFAHLGDAGFATEAAKDAELLRCVERAVERERHIEETQAKALDGALSILKLKGAAA